MPGCMRTPTPASITACAFHRPFGRGSTRASWRKQHSGGDAQRQPAVLFVFESFFLILLVLATMKGNKCKSSDAPNASAAMLEVQELRCLSTGRSCHAVSPACMRARRSAGPLHVRQPACCQARLAADTLPHTCKRQHAGGASSAVAGLLRAHVCIPCRTGNTGRTRSI
jgi:hypothetical protein